MESFRDIFVMSFYCPDRNKDLVYTLWQPLGGGNRRLFFGGDFIPGLKPSFFANPSHRSLSFSSSGLTTWIPPTFTVTSEHIRFYFLVFLFLHFLVVVSVQ